MRRVFTPHDRFQQRACYRGRCFDARQPDGVHLSIEGRAWPQTSSPGACAPTASSAAEVAVGGQAAARTPRQLRAVGDVVELTISTGECM